MSIVAVFFPPNWKIWCSQIGSLECPGRDEHKNIFETTDQNIAMSNVFMCSPVAPKGWAWSQWCSTFVGVKDLGFFFTPPFPIASMYGIFTYIYHQNQPNVGIYTIHGSYGFYPLKLKGIFASRHRMGQSPQKTMLTTKTGRPHVLLSILLIRSDQRRVTKQC